MHRNIFLFIWVTLGLIRPSLGFFDVFLGSFLGYIFGEFFKNSFGPGFSLLLAGPTQIVPKAILKLTPFLQPSYLTDRFVQFILSVLGWTLPMIANGATSIVEQTVNWSLDYPLRGMQKFLLFIESLITLANLYLFAEGPGGTLLASLSSGIKGFASDQQSECLFVLQECSMFVSLLDANLNFVIRLEILSSASTETFIE